MADTYECVTCVPPKVFGSSRALSIHLAKIHAEKPSAKPAPVSDQDAKDKFSRLLAKTSVSRLANALLKPLARKYNDPEIALTPAECGDIDGCAQDLMSEMDLEAAKSLLPYLPYIGALLIAGPIIVDKATHISLANQGQAPVKETKAPPVPAGQGRPTLSRKDIMPDAGGDE